MCSFNISKYVSDIISMDTKGSKKNSDPIEITDIQQLRNLQQQVANTKEKLMKNADNILPSKKTIKIVAPCDKSSDDNSKHDNESITHISDNNSLQIDTVCFLGINLPKSTFYLIIILICIAGVIWYMSGESKKKKNEEKNEE